MEQAIEGLGKMSARRLLQERGSLKGVSTTNSSLEKKNQIENRVSPRAFYFEKVADSNVADLRSRGFSESQATRVRVFMDQRL